MYPRQSSIYRGFSIPDLSVIQNMENRLKTEGQSVADSLGLEIEFDKVGGFDPVTLMITVLALCVVQQKILATPHGYNLRAGHDAC